MILNALIKSWVQAQAENLVFCCKEMYINGLTESEAIELIRERQSPVDKDTVFIVN